MRSCIKLYKREGRRFVPMQIEDRTGMFYQKDSTFTHNKDENTIGLCILSTIEHDVVMSLCDVENRLLTRKDVLRIQGTASFNKIPTTSEMFIALHEYRESLNIKAYRSYWCKNDRFCNENMFAASTGLWGGVCLSAAPYAAFIAGLRPVMRFKRFLYPL